MSVELKKLNFRRFAKNGAEMYGLLESNRTRLSPWFWWADKSVTPNKIRFYLFMALYITDTKRKKIVHKIKSAKSYDEQFFIYNDGKIAGMCGLDNIDVKNKQDAEVWYLTFRGNPFGTADLAIKWIENYCINSGLNSMYAKIQSTNEKSLRLVDRNDYTIESVAQDVQISKRNTNHADIITYKKQLTR